MNQVDSFAIDRSSRAKPIARRLRDTNRLQATISQGRELAMAMSADASTELPIHTHRLRSSIRANRDPSPLALTDDQLSLAIGIVQSAITRVITHELFDVQWQAGLVMSLGGIAEMQTGEGKTLAGVLPAFIHALRGSGVHVVTPNSYLARRDHEQLKPVLTACGLSCGVIVDNQTDEQARAAYAADVTYGSAHTFGFDYLRDQLQRRQAMAGPLGARFLSELRGQNVFPARGRGLAAAIVDEADDVLLDDAVSPLILSGGVPGEAVDAELHQRALQLVDELQINVDFLLSTGRRVELTNTGFERVYNDTQSAAHRQLLRPWHEYVVAALQAAHCYQRDVHYIVRDSEIALIDGSTGRVFTDRSWSGGLHQAVQAREGLTVRSESSTLARITKQRYFRSYQFLSGMTGTADQCQREFQCVYGTPVIAIAPRFPSRRFIASPSVTRSTNEKHAGIIAETIAMSESNRPVLIGTHSVSESQAIAARLHELGVTCELLNGIQDADEASVIARAGRASAITVATHLAGRGTDIRLDELAMASGGLHVIVSQMHTIERVDRQLIGRAARCGDPGSCRIFIAADDPLIVDHAPWIARHLHRSADLASVRGADQYRQLCTIQARRQRDASAWRMQLLSSDQREQSIFLRSSEKSPDACWAI